MLHDSRQELLFIEISRCMTRWRGQQKTRTKLIEVDLDDRPAKTIANLRERTKHEGVRPSRVETSQVFAISQSSYSIKHQLATSLLIFIYIFIFSVAIAASTTTTTTAAITANGQAQLPTVIVRGFLNYRTTVDGTVLLFTPDAGQQASSTVAAANSIQPTSTSLPLATSQPTPPQAPISGSSLVLSSVGRRNEIEPTSVPTLAYESLQTNRLDSSDELARSNRDEPADGGTAQANEWRPVQATPPLRAMATTTQLVVANEQPRMSTDEIGISPPTGSLDNTPVSSTESSRPKRPSLSYTAGQALRPRVPGTGGATSPSLQTRSRAGSTGGINGIRRPGLTTTGGPPSNAAATPSDPAALANAASAFQNRLATANTRLRNRFKHRQQSLNGADSTTNGGVGGSGIPAANSTNTAPGRPANNLIAPESLLDVASSIEQPTSAARSASLAPSGTSGQLGSSGPAVGSVDEILASVGSPGLSPPVVASDEAATITLPLVGSSSGSDPEPGQAQPEVDLSNPLDQQLSPEQQAGSAALSRAGEQRPSSSDYDGHAQHQQSRVISGQLQQGLLSSGPLQMDMLFQNDQPGQLVSSSSSSSSSPLTSSAESDAMPPAPARPAHKSRPPLSKPAHHNHNHSHHRPAGNNNEKLNGWLGAHHNKFVPRPASKPADSEPGQLSQALATNLNHLLPHQQQQHHTTTSQPPLAAATVTNASDSTPTSGSLLTAASDESSSSANVTNSAAAAAAATTTTITSGGQTNTTDITPMQTITRTYSTILETSKTRLVPLQVKSSTAIYTITEDYVMTKVMTAYQTLPAGAEFLLAEPAALSTRAPYEVFEHSSATSGTGAESKLGEQQVAAPPSAGGAARETSAPIDTQEQPISLDTSSPKSANNWLHDFSTNPDDLGLSGNDNFRSTQQEQSMLALLEQQARNMGDQANLSQLLGDAGGNPNEPLDQLASQLDPAALLADGTINIPDLNNPLVLAAAIQNPQLAAVILAAQQLKFKQRQQQAQQQQRPNQLGQLQQLQQQLAQQQQFQQLQPSYSTSFSTTVRPSTYVARDTMYTTRLVSFRDGRTVRTRTVSEPGSVIEQTLTTIVTETIPVTITIKPTGVPGGGSGGGLVPNTATLGQAAGQQTNQATIQNALFATQLANLLARRQQATQLQTSFQNPTLMNFAASSQPGAAATPQQLLALQHLFARQKQQQQQQPPNQQQQFQPNFNQLLASINQNQQATTNSSTGNQQQLDQSQAASSTRANSVNQQQQQQQQQATPALQQAPKSITSAAQGSQSAIVQLNNNNNNNNFNLNVVGNQPLTTTLTSLQVRTYTVHNAFKTIFRTITSTVLIPTVLSPGATLLPMLG